MSAEVDALRAQVAEARTAKQSALALVNGVADLLAKLSHDPVAIKRLADELHAAADGLATAHLNSIALTHDPVFTEDAPVPTTEVSRDAPLKARHPGHVPHPRRG